MQEYRNLNLSTTPPRSNPHFNLKASPSPSFTHKAPALKPIIFIFFLIACLVAPTKTKTPNTVALTLPTLEQNLFDNSKEQIITMLSAMSDAGLYIGLYESLEGDRMFEWISEKEGEMYFGVEELVTYDQLEGEAEDRGDCKQCLGQPQKKYIIDLQFLNPRYITQQVIYAQFDFIPSRLKLSDPFPFPQPGNTTTQTCSLIGPKQWSCNNTRLNYTRIWRRRQQDDGDNVVHINYRVKLEAEGDGLGDYGGYKIEIEVEGLEEVLRFRSKQPMVLKNRKLQFTLYCLLITGLTVLQIYSALKISHKFQQNPLIAHRFSLIIISYCTISDLSATIDYAYSIFQVSSAYYRILYIFPTIASGILYFAFDIQILTRILIMKMNRGGDGGVVNLKKLLILFYIGFFVSYEGFVLLNAFFQYEWWVVLGSSCLLLLPQVVKNVRQGFGGDDGFDVWYVMGFLCTRAFLTLYKFGCPNNYLKIKPFAWLASLLAVLFILQVTILKLQSMWSARFFVPKFLRPGFYQYSTTIKPSQLDGQHTECIICLQDIFNPVRQENSSDHMNNSQIIQPMLDPQKQISVYRTPCQHIFHEECLKSWVRVKLECPTCRAKLPVM